MKHKNVLAFILIIAVCAAFYAYLYLSRRSVNDSVPVFHIEEGELTVSVNDPESALLTGITATDKEDGDVSDSIIIESVSAFEDGCRTVMYAAFDSKNHIAKASRKIRYGDYVSPTFSLKESPSFYSVTEEAILGMVKATDVIDGDISSKITILSSDLIDSDMGLYEVVISVSNSAGDTVKASFRLVNTTRSASVPKIELKEYIVYLGVGDSFSPDSYIENIVSGIEGETVTAVTDGRVDTSAPGNYIITYTATNSKGYEGYAFLTVIVR